MDTNLREILKKRHDAHRAAEAEKKAKLEAERLAAEKAEAERLAIEKTIRETKRAEEELKANEENTKIDVFLSELSDTFSTLSYVDDLELSLQMMACGIDSIIELIKSNNRLDELKSIVRELVKVLDEMHENSHKSAAQVRKIKEAVQYIFSISEVEEIEIIAMDTSKDEETAKRFQAQEYEDHGEHPYYGANVAAGGAGGGGHAIPTNDAGGMPPLEAYPNDIAINDEGNIIPQIGEHT
jgi:hypothetical protein